MCVYISSLSNLPPTSPVQPASSQAARRLPNQHTRCSTCGQELTYSRSLQPNLRERNNKAEDRRPTTHSILQALNFPIVICSKTVHSTRADHIFKLICQDSQCRIRQLREKIAKSMKEDQVLKIRDLVWVAN